MPTSAIVTFTARNRDWILRDGGSQAWRLDADRARRCEFLICTQNRNNAGFGAPSTEHGHGFLIGRISGVVASAERPDRWLIKIADFIACDLPNIWARSGHLRYPVWYTTLEDLGIDLAALPPFVPLPLRDAPPLDLPPGMADATGTLLRPPPAWTPAHQPLRPPVAGNTRTHAPDDATSWKRLDAILAQLDRVPDRPGAFEALDWDEHGLPR
ncbi:MAG TPA: hypothetical protein VGG99_03175 [Acetobacteraceae bacterium]|jgi:hypothetical protein